MHDYLSFLSVFTALGTPWALAGIGLFVLVAIVLRIPTGRAALVTFLVWLDRLANWLLRGTFRETLSSRAYRMQVKQHRWWGWTAAVIDWFARVLFRQKDHCRIQYEFEVRNGWHKGDGT